MSNVSLSEVQYQSVTERSVMSVVTSGPCLVFLTVNGTMLWTLRSKAFFRDTSRYVLLFNLLLADTVQMSLAQLLYLLAVFRILLTYPLCGVLTMMADLTNEISPLTLVLMSLERYVAVCFPLQHSSIASVRNTAVSIVVVWAVCFLNVMVRVGLLLQFPFHSLGSLEMRDFCSSLATRIGPSSGEYDRGYTCFLFMSASAAIASSYVAVMLAVKKSAVENSVKARNTVLLHMFQLVLSLSSTVYTPLLLALARTLPRILFVRLQNAFYVVVFIFPRCLSSLIYGIRDQSIRPALLQNLFCRRTRTKPVLNQS